MANIPVFIIEEHHEAFLVWHYAIRNNLLDAENNFLLHVDTHDDFGNPRLLTPISEISGSMSTIYDFTYNQLAIYNFIIPAVYLKIFKEVTWIHNDTKREPAERHLYIRTLGEEGKFFVTAHDSSPWPHNKPWQDRVSFVYKTQTIDKDIASLDSFNNIVLDIDLDYFSCGRFRDVPLDVEVTNEEFEKFKKDKYHLLKIEGRCYAVEQDGHYLFRFRLGSNAAFEHDVKNDTEAILQRIEDFIIFLKKNDIQPTIINLCRSRISGYTPKENWEFVEKNLLIKLHELYSITIINIEELMTAL